MSPTTVNTFDLSGKVAIVTGSNTGLGAAMAVALAAAGCDIVGVSRAHAGATAARVEALGRRFADVRADLASIASVDDIVRAALEAFGRIDVLVNNAGIIRREDALEFGEDDWDAVMDVNLKSLFFLSQAAARQFVRQRSGGKIINVASMLSFQGGVRVASYTASKSGVLGLTRLLANEWAARRINVNAIAPGYMATANTAALREDAQRNEEILGRIPAGRWGVPDDLAGPVVFLASSASDYVHGHTLAVDGGWLAR
ncbi:2-dehydro-3-deoxy-D-gluconate 5-dehydrogenase KduD [Paraburkholderia sprentiae WSM5005]|uniref:2-dehydro-3-deoxy-D-gluconate 5-dehydrogenase n=1 Tax=Paraburkholderia sprentiae WSM5005 TaxID=754502 RepID=A0A1I9YEE6_9BURK|nr:2-dehydro-3-deoxy-D-gluconate 5-dehydrogenase KduD [Paraburkholderia sprentiae]APA84679.1 2-dehydro-3-deoxy-D-gluconate 5-dehydrogenase KduD [Paraburkholderia sprentiae WSM5005]